MSLLDQWQSIWVAAARNYIESGAPENQTDDLFIGTRAPEYVCSFGGHDVVKGGGGSDVIDGCEGDDVLYGNGVQARGREADIFYFHSASGHDTIMDWSGGVRNGHGAGEDIVELHLFGFDMTDVHVTAQGRSEAVITVDGLSDWSVTVLGKGFGIEDVLISTTWFDVGTNTWQPG